ncbi:MAG: DUF2007 domain-containing protein [Ignavibacteria bacterium]|nr:DUF2007 domain-containing protein [Ignavibacteria bacterium]
MQTESNLVKIFTTKKTGKAEMLKSFLDKTGLKYLITGDNIIDVYGSGKKEINFESVAGEIEFLVSTEDEINGLNLVEKLEDNERLVSVFKAGNEAIVATVKSILDEAEIPYLAKSEGLQSLFGVGVIGLGFNPITGPVEFFVMPEDVEYAAELLKDVELSGENDTSSEM